MALGGSRNPQVRLTNALNCSQAVWGPESAKMRPMHKGPSGTNWAFDEFQVMTEMRLLIGGGTPCR